LRARRAFSADIGGDICLDRFSALRRFQRFRPKYRRYGRNSGETREGPAQDWVKSAFSIHANMNSCSSLKRVEEDA